MSRRPVGRVAAGLVAAIHAGCAGGSEGGGEREEALGSLVAAERAFAAASLELGRRTAFLEHLHQDAYVFTPAATPAIAFWQEQPDRDDVLFWDPAVADISADGDFGYTTGPWEYRANEEQAPSLWGQYLSVWRRGEDGIWKVTIDGGVSHGRVDVVAGGAVAYADAAGGAEAVGLPSLLAADRAFSEAAEAGAYPDSFGAYVSPDARFLRDAMEPVAGVQTALGTPGVVDFEGLSWTPTDGEVAASGDIGYTYGVARFTGGEAVYYRVWKRDTGRWLVVVDLMSALPVEAD